MEYCSVDEKTASRHKNRFIRAPAPIELMSTEDF
jgi:hypothetical protein